jgi:hypothetical protein
MSKLMRGLVLGAMLAVLSSATAVAAQPPDGHDEAVQRVRAGERASLGQPDSRDEAVQQFRAGERASADQPVVVADAVQQFRAGERAASGQLTQSDKATQLTLAAQRYWYYRSTRPVPTAAPASPAQPDGQDDTPVGLLVALVAVAVLSIGLDAMFVRRKARKARAHPAV